MHRISSRVFVVAMLIALLSGCASRQVELVQTERPKLDYEAYGQAMRDITRFDTGGAISRVRWSEDGTTLQYVRLQKRYEFDLTNHKLSELEDEEGQRGRGRSGRDGWSRQRGPGRGRQYDRQESPDGKWTAVCRDWNVSIEPNGDAGEPGEPGESGESGESGGEDAEDQPVAEPIQVTMDGHRKFRYGTANWVYGEELFQTTAMWWSPDSRRLVFYEFDERQVPDFLLLSGLTELRNNLLREGYSKAGEANPKVGLLVYDLDSGRITRVETDGGMNDEWYIYNVRFTPDGSEILFNRTNRHQDVLHVVAADPDTGASRIVVTETQPTWQENSPFIQFLADGKRFIWETEKTGYRQFELRHLDGRLLATLTRGEYPAISVERVDGDAGVMYYTAYSGDHPLNAHLNRVNLDGTGQRRLTREPANHTVSFSPDGKWFIARYETIEQPPTTALYDTEGDRIATLAESDPQLIADLGYPQPEMFSFKAEDGVTDIYGVLYKPRGFDPTQSYPLLIDVYGGPDSRAVNNRYRVGNAVCEMGYIVASIDNRGTSGRGKAFMGEVYQKLGIVDIQDQADGVRYLRQRPYIDGSRVGIFGHSYGGFMSQLAVLKYPDVFQVAAAGAGLATWRNYDTIYTERYMRTPQENPEGYEDGSCLKYVDQLKGRLLILHGMVDDNVHPNNAWQLVDALQQADKPFEIMFYANQGHGLGRHATKARWEFLHKYLIEQPVIIEPAEPQIQAAAK